MSKREALESIAPTDLHQVVGAGFGDWVKRNAHNILPLTNPVTAPIKLGYEAGKAVLNGTYNAGYDTGRAC